VCTLLTPFLSRFRASLGLALALLLAGVTAAGADPQRRPAEPRVLGDMEWRNKFFDKGVDLQLVYVSETAYNLGGGVKQLVDYIQQVAVGTMFDLKRIVGLKDAVIQVTYTSRAGRNLVDDAQLGTFQLVQEVFGRRQTVRLTKPGGSVINKDVWVLGLKTVISF
jgi:porin